MRPAGPFTSGDLAATASPLPSRCSAPRLLSAPPSAGNLPVKPNKYVEEWGTRREHVENEFRCGLCNGAGRAPRALWPSTLAPLAGACSC